MGSEIRRRDGVLEIESGRIRLVFDLARATLSVESPADGVRISGFAPRALCAGELLRARDARIESAETDADGHTRVRALCRSDSELELELAIDLPADGAGLILDLTAHNRGAQSLRLQALDPLCWSGGGSELALPGESARLRFFRMGYQSWSPAGFVALGRGDRRPRLALLRDLYCGPLSPLPQRGQHVSDVCTTLRAPGLAGLTLGFLSHREYLTHVCLGVVAGRPGSLVARCSLEERELVPGGSLRAERLWLGIDAAACDGLALWAERCGREMNARLPERVPVAWCSWYQFFTKVRADDVARAAQRLLQQDVGVDTIQLDDGFQTAVGDWSSWTDGFPDGIAPVAREIRAAGFRAGLWLAPLLVSRQSRTAQEHPDWLLQRGGKPRVALVNKDWKGKVCYALDPTHPEVLAWLEELGRNVREAGFDYLKLDFLYAGTLPGDRHDKAIPTGAAYRAAIGAIRRGAGEDVFLLGCGAPLGPSIGLFEAMRIGPDVAPHWASPIADRLFGVKAAPAAVNSIRNVLARAQLHKRVWLNDPDCALLRDRDTKLDETEVQTLTSVIAMSGGLLAVSDDPENLSPERQRLQARVLPPLPITPRVAPSDAEIPDQLYAAFPDQSLLVLRVNLSDSARSLPIEPVALGFEGPLRAYDVWHDRELDPAELGRAATPVPAHGCRLVRLVPDDGRPRVLGSTLHLGAGALETREVRLHPAGGAQVELELAGARRGHLTVALPDGTRSARVHLGFRDRFSVRVACPGLEEVADLSDR